MHRRAMIVAAFMTTTCAAANTRGAAAFFYQRSASDAQLAWLSRFEVVVTHDPLPPVQIAELHRHGTKLVLYEWSVAFYASLAKSGSFQKRLLRERKGLLNERPLRGGAGAPDADAFYYDPASEVHVTDRAAAIATRLREVGYDGVFLDTTTAANVHPSALAEFQQRHPHVDYDEAFARFMRQLRQELPHGTIVTNQGYRSAVHYLPYVDIDITESLISGPLEGSFALRPWSAPSDRWNSVDFIFRNEITPVARAYPKVRFVHLNYAESAHDVLPIVAAARLFGHDAFVARPDVPLLPAGDYFLDLGAPSDDAVREGATAYRQFAHGLVAINAGTRTMAIRNHAPLVDVSTGNQVRGDIVVPPPAHGIAWTAAIYVERLK